MLVYRTSCFGDRLSLKRQYYSADNAVGHLGQHGRRRRRHYRPDCSQADADTKSGTNFPSTRVVQLGDRRLEPSLATVKSILR